jgi:hypothetical protein
MSNGTDEDITHQIGFKLKDEKGHLVTWFPAFDFGPGSVTVHVTTGAIGHAHLTEPPVETPPPGTLVTIDTTPPPKPVVSVFFAICQRQHDSSMAGVDPASGIWRSVTSETCDGAKTDADLHEDGGAEVVELRGDTFLGPIGCG